MGGVLNSVSKGTEGTEESKGEHFLKAVDIQEAGLDKNTKSDGYSRQCKRNSIKQQLIRLLQDLHCQGGVKARFGKQSLLIVHCLGLEVNSLCVALLPPNKPYLQRVRG